MTNKNEFKVFKGELYWLAQVYLTGVYTSLQKCNLQELKYIGNFDDSLTGCGQIIFKDGSIFIGDFIDGYPYGKGKLTQNNGAEIEGYFQSGHYTGLVKISMPNGDVFEGNTVNQIIEGYGKYTWANGAIFEGDFIHNGIGQIGKYTDSSGVIIEALYSGGEIYKMISATWPDGFRCES